MLAIVSLIACCGIYGHSCSKSCWSLLEPSGKLRPAIPLPIRPHRCSMGFRSGDLAGDAICGMVSLSSFLRTNRALCGRALSSINIMSVPIAAIRRPLTSRIFGTRDGKTHQI
ncbi:hypothetical protein AVEN_236746-1 [Araneus ventricosus]|uniref:Secreted protein n=1 Tax=Araneus ventricosus TaxID=182803 RepID=A0A4Y2D240_ARAVE|nr:hypothetical protein AVEN_236746-1 [Araneus ventricosus]